MEDTSNLPVLYVKTGCPWCIEVSEYLAAHGVGFREQNVSQDPQARERMWQVSHQEKAPVLDWQEKILADFGVEELKPFLQAQNVRLEDS